MSEEKTSPSSNILKSIGALPDECATIFLLLAWVLQPANTFVFIGLMIASFMMVKKATFPIKVIKFVKSGESERIEFTEARKYTIKEDGILFTRLSIIGKKEDINMPDAKYFRFNKRSLTNLFQGESIIMDVSGENYTPVFKPQGAEEFISEADRHEQIQDMKKRKERIENKDAKDKFLTYMPYILLIGTCALMIWVITEMEGIIITDLPHTIRVAASDIIKELFVALKESGQTISIDSVNNTLGELPI